MAPPELNMSDIFTIYTNYEPSPAKIWEIVRSYDPIEFVTLLYVLDNVTKSRKRPAIHIDDEHIAKFSTIDRTCTTTVMAQDEQNSERIIQLSTFKSLRVERCVDYYTFDNEMFVKRANTIDMMMMDIDENEGGDGDGDDDGNNESKQASAKTSNTTIQANDNALTGNVSTIFWNRIVNNQWTTGNKTIMTTTSAAQRQYRDTSITELMNKLRNIKDPQNLKPSSDDPNHHNIYERIINHNFGTFEYSSLLTNIQFLLFNDNFQMSRNETNARQNSQSIVELFLQFYKNLTFSQTVDNDPRNFHFLVIPQARQYPISELNAWSQIENLHLRRNMSVTNADDDDDGHSKVADYIHQPYFHGIHLIVYSSPTETKCYNRFGDLYPNFAYTVRSHETCTFEAVILPTDSYNIPRSWRYWQYRQGWIMYVVDVLRYKQTVLLNRPFSERIKYAKYIANGVEIHQIPKELTTIEGIYARYKRNRDIYDSIVGVYRRHSNHILCQPTLDQLNAWKQQNTLNGNETNLKSITASRKFIDHHRNSYSLFNILFTFDILELKVITLDDHQCHLERLHMNLEMADYRVICMAYAHSEEFIYLCRYDRSCHQFVHAASLSRLNYESCKLNYRPDKIYVVNHKALPLGILYLRVYFDINRNVMGYDTKVTDGRYKVPYENILYS